MDDIRFVGSNFELDCQSDLALWSVTCFPFILRVLFVSVSDSQILSLRPLVMIAESIIDFSLALLVFTLVQVPICSHRVRMFIVVIFCTLSYSSFIAASLQFSCLQ